MRLFSVSLFAGVLAACLLGGDAHGQLLHLWEFDGPDVLADSAGALDLNFAPGEGNVGGVMGHPIDVSFSEADYSGFGRAYRPFYVDPNTSTTAGAGLTGSGFASPNQFTIETIVKADIKTTGSAVNYIFQTRPVGNGDRGYYLIQDENNAPRGAPSGLGSVIGSSFADSAIPVGHDDDEHWFYIAAAIDLTTLPGQASANIYAADLTAGGALMQVATNRVWTTQNPSSLAGFSGIFGIGNFAIDRQNDGVAEASQEWFQGAIDYVAIYNGLLSQSELQANLDIETTRTPEPASLVLLGVGGLCVVIRRRR